MQLDSKALQGGALRKLCTCYFELQLNLHIDRFIVDSRSNAGLVNTSVREDRRTGAWPNQIFGLKSYQNGSAWPSSTNFWVRQY